MNENIQPGSWFTKRRIQSSSASFATALSYQSSGSQSSGSESSESFRCERSRHDIAIEKNGLYNTSPLTTFRGGIDPTLIPSPLRPRSTPTDRYLLFPPQISPPGKQNVAKAYRSLSSMLRIPSGPARPSSVAVCIHGHPIVVSATFQGRKMARPWWQKERLFKVQGHGCWRCELEERIRELRSCSWCSCFADTWGTDTPLPTAKALGTPLFHDPEDQTRDGAMSLRADAKVNKSSLRKERISKRLFCQIADDAESDVETMQPRPVQQRIVID